MERGVDAPEDLVVSLLPNLLGCCCEYFHEEIVLTILFVLFNGVEVYVMVPMYI
jgi:hypothetical protein